MYIDSITNTLNKNYNFYKNPKKQTQQNTNYSKPIAVLAEFPIPFLGKPKIPKDMPYFLSTNQHRLPTTVKLYLETVKDKFLLTPLEAHKNAYAPLKQAKNIKDVQELFSEEELFIYLNPLEKTESNRGILKIYREFKELYENGILSTGEDFVVYILRKIFSEAKLMDEINSDLDNDLNSDIKAEFLRKYKNNNYIDSDIIKALGIYYPDLDYWNSLKFTRDGYSDTFGEKVSKGLKERWNKLTEEEQTAELIKRGKGLENWWNSKSFEEKLELATGIDSDGEAYKDYKNFKKENQPKTIKIPDDIPYFEETEPKKKIKIELKINDKDLFNLWMQNNLKKFYGDLTEQDKDIIDIKRSKILAKRWADMSPEARIDYIDKIRTAIEPIRYAMIDTWNHSRLLIRILSEYLREQQILKPLYLLYDTSEFIEFQSRIMTEFWAQNKDLAKKFGDRMKYSHQIVENAIKEGKFEELKKQILEEKEERIRVLKQEYLAEAEELKKLQEEKIKAKEAAIPKEDINYRKDFAELYEKSIDKYGILPQSYTKEMAEIFLDKFPKDIAIRYGNALKNNEHIPQDVIDYIVNEQKKNDASPRTERIQRSLEAAIAAEMTSKGANPALFQINVNELISILNHRYTDITVPNSKRIDMNRISRLYKEYNRDLSDEEANNIANSYFTAKRELTKEENEMFENYLNSYGRSLFILFSDKSAYSDAIKHSFNEKFLRLMPREIKEFIRIFIQSPADIQEEKEISSLIGQMYKRFKYIPDDILKIYTKEIAFAIRLDRETHENKYLQKFKNTFYNKAFNEKGQNFPQLLKTTLQREELFKILAIEQAMADEFYKVSKSEDVYSRNFEELLNFYDLASIMKSHDTLTMEDKDGTKLFIIKEKPSTKTLYTKYLRYLRAIEANKEIINPDGTINKEELLYCLNPLEDKPERDLSIMKRINSHFNEQTEPEQIQQIEKSKTHSEEKTSIDTNQYKKDFRIEYFSETNPKNILPNNYTKEMAEIILDTFPKDTIEKYILNPSSRNMLSNKMLQEHCSKENLKRLNRIQHALEAAIASELVDKGGDRSLFGESIETLISELEKQEIGFGRRKQNKIDTEHIQELYNEYRKDLTQKELIYIVNSYFTADNPTREKDKLIMDYIAEYGRTASILFSGNTNIPLKVKEAFNNKFLKLMPQNVKNEVTPLLKNIADISDDYNIEMVRRQLAKRFDFLPDDPRNVYTHEAANVMRMMRMPDVAPELKENYNMNSFIQSLGKNNIDSGEIASVLRFPKYLITNNVSKLYLLALEQALADELYRVSKNDIVYKYELEELILWFELGAAVTKDNKKGMEIKNSENDDGFVIKAKPDKNRITQKYVKYMKEFESSEDLYLEDGKLNREEILYCLNPNEDMPERDKYTRERIDGYFED